jgi:hypothetical protein
MGMDRVQDIVEFPERHDAWHLKDRGDSRVRPVAPELPGGIRRRHAPPILWKSFWSQGHGSIEADGDDRPGSSGEESPVLGVGEYLKRGQRAIFRHVDSPDAKGIPTSRKLRRTMASESSPDMAALANPPRFDHANTPFSNRPSTCSTSLAPCSEAIRESGARPPRTASGLASQPRALSSLSRTFTARTKTRMSLATRSDSSGFSFPLASSRRRMVFSVMLTKGAIPEGANPNATARCRRMPAGSPRATSSAIFRSLPSG